MRRSVNWGNAVKSPGTLLIRILSLLHSFGFPFRFSSHLLQSC